MYYNYYFVQTYTTYKIKVASLLNRLTLQIREEIPSKIPTAVIEP